jgi:uncharacterized protein
VKAELEKLIDLQITDTNIRRLRKAIDTADQRRAEIQQEFEQHAFSIREIQARRDTAKAEQAEFEKQIAENQTYLERADRNLKNSQNQKEYETAMRETDALQKQIGTLETQALEKQTAAEEIEKSLEERADEINTLESKRDAALKGFDSEVKKATSELASETAKRDKIFVTLPKNLASVYDRFAQRSKEGIAVAEVINGSCSACFMQLRPQIQLEVKRGDQIITCENCARIMYIASKKDIEAAA